MQDKIENYEFMKKRLYGLKPIITNRTKILILGSFPSKISLKKKEYYANPRNQFWSIMFDVLQRRKPETYKEKKRVLLNNKIGLWDVISSCYRRNSSDGNIIEPKVNNILQILMKYPNIKTIFLNGKTAERFFKRCNSIRSGCLPSTSTANVIRYKMKKKIWSKIFKLNTCR